MERTFWLYLMPIRQGMFRRDLTIETHRVFAHYGLQVSLNDRFDLVLANWQAVAEEMSLRIPNPDRSMPTTKDALRLSHIKHAGILAHTLAAAGLVERVQREQQYDVDGREDHGRVSASPASELLLTFPNQMLALEIVDALFDRYQVSRKGRFIKGYNPMTLPRSRHLLTNLCIFLSDGTIGPEAMYMIYKTRDWLTFLPDPRDAISLVPSGKPA